MSEFLNSQIVNNTNYIEYAKSLYGECKSIRCRVQFLDYLVKFMTLHVTTGFSDSFIENELNEISRSLKFKLDDEYKNNSVLHVMSEAYSTGGHTKLLELFVDNAKDYFSEQSVVITNQVVDLPQKLKSTINDTGTITVLQCEHVLDKAMRLAKIASGYQYVILHIHPEDITANLAFGNSNFKRVVGFLNHADHMFWCGLSVSDFILDMNKEGSEFSLNVRGAKNSHIINIPIEDKKITITKEQAREQLQIDKSKKIVLSIASEYKYGRTREEIFNFVNMALKIINNVSDCEFLLIGPSKENEYWNEAYELSHGKINPLGIKERDQLGLYIISSDLYIESFPFASYTAFLDTAMYNINMLSLKTPVFTLDAIKDNDLLAKSVDEIVKRAVELLNSKSVTEKKLDLSRYLKEQWSENVKSIFALYENQTHEVKSFTQGKAEVEYLNHIYKIINSNNTIFADVFNVLPAKIKLKLLFKMKKYNVINSYRFMFKLLRKIIKVKLYGR